MNRADRRIAIARAYLDNEPLASIAERFGVSVWLIYSDLKALGVRTGDRRRLNGQKQMAHMHADPAKAAAAIERERENMRRKASDPTMQFNAQAARYNVPPERIREWRRLRGEGWAPREIALYMGLVD